MEDGVEEYPLAGFDPEGEPHIRRTAQGRLWLGFNFMPPSWADEADCPGPGGPWADFDVQLSKHLGTAVVWEDREWFRVDAPGPDAVSAIAQFLDTIRRQLDPQAPSRLTSRCIAVPPRRLPWYRRLFGGRVR